MTFSRLFVATLAGALLALPAPAVDAPARLPQGAPPPADVLARVPPSVPWWLGDSTRMRRTRLAPAKLTPDICVLRYRISTTSPECQAYFDQGLGYFYSYVWMEAARSFETATYCDPDCPMAWWGLYRGLLLWGKRDKAMQALLKADELKGRASWREQQLILASMQETGNAPGAGDAEARKKAAIATLDNLLAVHDDDEEAWYFRAQLAGGAGGFGGVVSAVPYYKALLKVNPLHPGANHELVHFYEKVQRPALGWPYAEKYIESSPGLPHAFHMQAHLGTRLGRWSRSTEWSARAIELEKAYHKEMNVQPRDDHQYSHHLEILLASLTHDGRFTEARGVKRDMEAAGYKSWGAWFRLHLAERDYAEALKITEELRRTDKVQASYLAALVHLKRGDPAAALPEIEVLQHIQRERRSDKKLELDLWEVQGLYLCRTGSPDAGLSLLRKTVDRTKNDYSHHSWGNGAYYMELWGMAALGCGRDDVAEEAYLEALAHDPGSVRAALGLQVLCESQGRTQEAGRYAELARRCWARADSQRLGTELTALRELRSQVTGAGSSGGR
jgi:tetratricopeptide (TPR) repeat protein